MAERRTRGWTFLDARRWQHSLRRRRVGTTARRNLPADIAGRPAEASHDRRTKTSGSAGRGRESTSPNSAVDELEVSRCRRRSPDAIQPARSRGRPRQQARQLHQPPVSRRGPSLLHHRRRSLQVGGATSSARRRRSPRARATTPRRPSPKPHRPPRYNLPHRGGSCPEADAREDPEVEDDAAWVGLGTSHQHATTASPEVEARRRRAPGNTQKLGTTGGSPNAPVAQTPEAQPRRNGTRPPALQTRNNPMRSSSARTTRRVKRRAEPFPQIRAGRFRQSWLEPPAREATAGPLHQPINTNDSKPGFPSA